MARAIFNYAFLLSFGIVRRSARTIDSQHDNHRWRNFFRGRKLGLLAGSVSALRSISGFWNGEDEEEEILKISKNVRIFVI